MLSSATRSFHDPWDHQAFFRAADMKVIVTNRGDYCSELTRIDLHRLWMQRNQTSLPQIAYIDAHEYRCPIAFLTDDRQASIQHNGKEMPPGTIAVISRGGEYHNRMSGPSRIGFMSLAPDDLAHAGRALTGHDLIAPPETRRIRPPEHLMARLLRLHEAAGQLAATTPDILAHPEVAKAIEQELVRTMVACLTEGREVGSDRRPRRVVMRRFEQVLEENPDGPLYVPEICAAIGATDRTLRLYCAEELGMSPHRYLQLRRLNLARRALALADPAKSTVTAIANDYGFAELGRFAVAYRETFGESPLATLRRASGYLPR